MNNIICYNTTTSGLKVTSHQHTMLYFIARYHEYIFNGLMDDANCALLCYCNMYARYPDFIYPTHAEGQTDNYMHKAGYNEYKKMLGLDVEPLDRYMMPNNFVGTGYVFPENKYDAYFYSMSGKKINILEFNRIRSSLMPSIVLSPQEVPGLN